MRILFVSALLPYPLHSGGQVRVYNLLKRLGTSHKITLCTFLREYEEKDFVRNLPFCQRVETVYRGHAWQLRYITKSLLTSYPFLFATYALDEMKTIIQKELSNDHYDLIHLEPSYVWGALPQTQLPLVITEHNIEYLGYKGYIEHLPSFPLRYLLSIDIAKLAGWERRLWKSAAKVIAVSMEDSDIIRREVPESRVAVVPNGVDIQEFSFQSKSKINDRPIVLFVGNFSWHQNRDAVTYLLRDTWPLITNAFPRARLRIVGRGASSDFATFIHKSGAELLDGVENIQQEYHRADVLIAPIRIGSGSRYKILEAMASGLPVITTPVGASGIDVVGSRDLLISTEPVDFVSALRSILKNDGTRHAMVASARKIIERKYNWNSIAVSLERVWKEASVYEKRL